MSFILDALRKSEHERQRQTGPALVEVPVAAPRPRTNAWGTAAIVLLLVNLLVIGGLLLYRSGKAPPTAPAAPSAQDATVGQASAPPTPEANMPRPPAFGVWESVPSIMPPGNA